MRSRWHPQESAYYDARWYAKCLAGNSLPVCCQCVAVRSLAAPQTRNLHTGEINVAFIIIFSFGYLFGGVSALCILGLAVAARQGDQGHATPPPVEKRA